MMTIGCQPIKVTVTFRKKTLTTPDDLIEWK